MITASMLYNFVECPQRMSLDMFGDPAAKDKENPFVTLLWERGTKYEQEVVQRLTPGFANLRLVKPEDRFAQTLALMKAKTPLIYGGRIEAGDLLGEPDFLRFENDRYVPIDIKSGRGEEGGSEEEGDGRPKIHYAVQLGLYVDVLQQLGLATGNYAYILDINGYEVRYDFDATVGVRDPHTLLDKYHEALTNVRLIADKKATTTPAYSAVCKLCHWYTACLKSMHSTNDLTLIFDLGRSKRDILATRFKDLSELARANPADYFQGKDKTIFPRIGQETLVKLQRRAALSVQADGKPYLTAAVALPNADKEIYFDIEVDPLRNFCYLHGFVERNRKDETWTYKPFFAEKVDPALEKEAFAGAWKYLSERNGAPVFYYSKYERTWWRNLARRYGDVCTVEEVDGLFASPGVVDLYYDVVRGKTEWPTIDYSIKTLAQHLGFKWRDSHPSGAASVEWFDQWITTGDETVRERILQYNEDDCSATGILADGIRTMKLF